MGYEAPDMETILANHGLDSTAFAHLMDYYAQHPEEYVAMYEKVLSRMGEEEILRMR